jgi:polar amino acid transport system substrate-binding protein
MIAALLLALTAPQARADIKVGVAAEPFPPFSMKDASGHWTGWEIDLLNAVCARMNEKCDIVEVAWDGILPALQAHHFDMIWSAMAITPERRERIAFSNFYYKSAILMAGKKSGEMDMSPAHLADKAVGVQAATVTEKYAAKFYEPAGATLKRYGTQDEAMQDLSAGRVDYILASAGVVGAFLASAEGKACCELKGVVPDDPVLGEGVAAGLRKDDPDLKQKLDTAIAAAAKSGDFDRVTAKYPELKTAITYPQP